MTRILKIALYILIVILAGCATPCKRCHGQVVIDATGVAEFDRMFVKAWNIVGESMSGMVLKTSFQIANLPVGDGTKSVQTVAYQRIMDASAATSLYSQLDLLIKQREIQRVMVATTDQWVAELKHALWVARETGEVTEDLSAAVAFYDRE